MTSPRSLRRRRATALAAAACIAAGGLTLALSVPPAGAGTKGSCAGEHVLEWQENHNRLELVRVVNVVGVVNVELTTALEAGTYDVETIAYDGFIGRGADVPFEDSERYMIQFVDKAGDVVGETGTTDDLADGVDEVEERFSWRVELTATATGVRFVQVANFEGPEDLVGVGCIGITAVQPAVTTPTTETPTTETPTTETPTTETPTTETPLTPVSVTPTTAAPTTAAPTTAAPTTAAPVEVSSVEAEAANTRAPVRTLPVTGPQTGELTAIGVLLLGAGGAMVLRARRLA